MCLDDGCDEFLCCLCAPLAAIFCCKICKDQIVSNNVNQAPDSTFFQQPDRNVPVASVYPGGLQPQYPGQNQTFQGNYFPPNQGYARNDLPTVSVNQQPRLY